MNVQVEKDKFKKYLVFQVDNRVLSLPLIKIREIVTEYNIEPVPNSNDNISGLINLRGQIIKVLDVKYMFSKSYTEFHDRKTSIIVLETQENNVGIIVDDVLKVEAFDIEEISSVPKNTNNRMDNLIEYVYKNNEAEICFILDLDKLLNNKSDLQGVER